MPLRKTDIPISAQISGHDRVLGSAADSDISYHVRNGGRRSAQLVQMPEDAVVVNGEAVEPGAARRKGKRLSPCLCLGHPYPMVDIGFLEVLRHA